MKTKITKALLQKLYVDDGLSGLQVSKKLNIPRTSLSRLLDKHNIPRKSISEVMTGRKLSEEHRNKVVKTLNHKRGSGSHNWKGGKHIDGSGYRRVYTDNGYVKEHRMVMEKHLGRRLKCGEHIHHIDGDALNNSIDNLLLISNSEHIKLHNADQEFVKNKSAKMKKIRADKFWSTSKRD